MSRFMLGLEVKDMKRTGEVSKLTGIGKRTLQRYDEWGLISPKRSESGYMLFSEDDLIALFLVKLFKDLGYTTNDIRTAFSKPDFDVRESLDCRIAELEMQLRKAREQLFFAKEMRKLIENENGPSTEEAICALLRHSEYAWILMDDENEEGKELVAYLKWAETAYGRITCADPLELDGHFKQIIDEANEFGPFTHIIIQMFVSLVNLEARCVPADSEEAYSVVAAAYEAVEDAIDDDPYVSFYLLEKLYETGGSVPPRVVARLDEQSMEQMVTIESYVGEALRCFIEKLGPTEKRRREIEEFEN